jgi:hypothetical protein
MIDQFSPSFLKFQADIEAYLATEGKRERTKDGFIIFHGYDHALRLMFNRYLEHESYEPLVSHFRAWNWEHSYNDYLLRLTDALRERRNWPLLKLLWSGVISKRRKLYNDIRKLERKSPGKVPSSSAQASRDELLESLERVRSYSGEIGNAEDSISYELMISKVKAGRMA